MHSFLLTVGVSYNQPKLCPSATWNPNAKTLRDSGDNSKFTSIFVNSNDTIYVGDAEYSEVLVWLNDDVSPTSITLDNIWKPNSIFVTINGDIYVDGGDDSDEDDEGDEDDEDDEGYKVFKLVSNTKTFISVMSVDSWCSGLFVDINDTLYCSMHDYHKVVKRWLCNNATKWTTAVAGTGAEGFGPTELFHPYGIFVDINFDLYVADYENNRIQLFQSGQRNGTTVAGFKSSVTTISLNGPTGVVLDADKYLFIVDSDNNRIVGSGSEGFRCIVGCSKSPGSESNKLKEPWSLSFDSLGNIFVTDWENSRIQKFVLLTNSCSKYESTLLRGIRETG